MGKYSVPEHIRAMKPKGTMVKAIGGHWYVYEYRSVRSGGKRRTEMGANVGKIEEGVGFVPNSNYARGGEVTTLEFGQYAVALANSGGVLELLRGHFNPQDAAQVYALAVVNCVNGMQPAEQVGGLAILAREFGLLASVGSDFHAPGDWSELGLYRPLPDDLSPLWTRFGCAPSYETV